MLCNHVYKRIVAFSYRYWGKFLLKKMRRNCLESFFFHRKRRVLFLFFPCFSNRFFFERFFPLHFIFFLVVNDLTDFVGFAIYFFFIVMKRHNRFFGIGDFCFIPAGHSQTMGWLHKLHELPS